MNKKTSSTEISNPSCGYYFSSGIVVSETVYSSASHGPLYNVASRIIVDGGRKAIAAAAMAGMLVQNLKTPAEAATYIVVDGETVNNKTLNFGDNMYVADDGTANNTVINSIGHLYVADYGTVNNTIISSGGKMNLDGGTANGLTIKDGGYVYFERGNATGVQWNTGATVEVDIAKYHESMPFYMSNWLCNLYVKGTNQDGNNFSIENGVARNLIIDEYNYVWIGPGGSAYNLTQKTGGAIWIGVTKADIVYNVPGYNKTHIDGTNENGLAMSLENGVARNFVVNYGGPLQLLSGGSAYNIVQKTGGNINVEVRPGDGSYLDGINQAGQDLKLENGVATNFILNGEQENPNHIAEAGYMDIYPGGRAVNVTQNAPYAEYYDAPTINVLGFKPGDGTYVQGTNMYGVPVSLENGVATNFVINNDGAMLIQDGGKAINTEVNGYGYLIAESGASMVNPTINDHGIAVIKDGGYASDVVMNNGALIATVVKGGDTSTYISGTYNGTRHFKLENRIASGFYINQGHVNWLEWFDSDTIYNPGLQILSGGRATAIYAPDGGVSAEVYPDDTETLVSGSGSNWYKGNFDFKLSGGIASGFYLGDYDYLTVHSGGSAIEITQNQNYDEGGGNVNVEVIPRDTKTLVSGTNTSHGTFEMQNGSASNFVINPGGSMKVYAGGSAINTTVIGDLEDFDNLVVGNIVMSGNNTLYGSTNVSGGLISFARTENNAPMTLKIENLSAETAIFDMNVDLENQTADKIIITEKAEGNAYIRLNNTAAGAGNINGTNLHLVEYPDDADYDAEFELWGRKYRYGVHNYTLSQGYDEDEELVYWYLSGGGGGEYIPVYAAALTMPQISVVGINITLNSLQKRLGDLRGMGNSDGHGVWARAYYKGMTVKGEAETDMNTAGTEVGYDYVAMDDGNARLYLGLMAGAASYSGLKSEGKSAGEKYRNDGSGSSVLGGVYGTYIMDNGWFFDATLRAGTSELDISNYTYDEDFDEWDKVSFKPKRTFAAASIEAGKLFDKRVGGIGWKFEPKAEIQLTNTPAKTIKDSDGEELRFGGVNYITGIATLSAAYSRGDGIEPYAEVSWSQEISGKEDITYLTETEESSMKGGTAEIAVGLNMKLSDDLYWHAAASYESGSKKKGYGADAGIRYMFGGSGRKANSDKAINAKDDHLPQPTEQKENEQEIVITENPQQSAENEIIYEDNPAKIITASRPSGEIFTILDVDEYDVKAEEAEKVGTDSGIMPIPSAGILFQIGKSEILPYYHPMLDRFVNLYKQTDGNAKIQIEGYSSNGGNETVKNPDLSKQRARSVYKYLTDNGISKENISVKAYGNRRIGEGLFRGDPNCRAGQCYRRVDVSIIGN